MANILIKNNKKREEDKQENAHLKQKRHEEKMIHYQP